METVTGWLGFHPVVLTTECTLGLVFMFKNKVWQLIGSLNRCFHKDLVLFLALAASCQPKTCFPKQMPPLSYCTCSVLPQTLLQQFSVVRGVLSLDPHHSLRYRWGPYPNSLSKERSCGLKGAYLFWLLRCVPFLFTLPRSKFSIKRTSWSFILNMVEISQGSKILTPPSLLPLVEKRQSSIDFSMIFVQALHLEIFWVYIFLP